MTTPTAAVAIASLAKVFNPGASDRVEAPRGMAALKAEGLDTEGTGFAPRTVTLNPGGE